MTTSDLYAINALLQTAYDRLKRIGWDELAEEIGIRQMQVVARLQEQWNAKEKAS